jgi:hypothetical protein
VECLTTNPDCFLGVLDHLLKKCLVFRKLLMTNGILGAIFERFLRLTLICDCLFEDTLLLFFIFMLFRHHESTAW